MSSLTSISSDVHVPSTALISAGIYVGSFDPPHHGHLEAVTHALLFGMKKVTIVYRDINPFKPYRTADAERKEMLNKMFAGMQQVVISDEFYPTVLQSHLNDRSISRVHHIYGSDLFQLKEKVKAHQSKLEFFIVPRVGYPVPPNKTMWGAQHFTVFSPERLRHQHYCSMDIRDHFIERKENDAALPLPPEVIAHIQNRELYKPTDAEFAARKILLEVKKIVGEEIAAKKLLSIELYPLTLSLGKDMGFSGLSGDLVCFILDKNKKAHFVVKIFCGEVGNIDSETRGMKIINDLRLKSVSAPRILFGLKRQNYSLLGMSLASGKTLTSLMKDSKDAVRLCAKACLELQLANRRPADKIEDSQLEVFEEAIGKVMTRLKAQSHFKIDPNELSKRWDNIHQAFVKNPGYLSYTHGDPNPNNYIVDLKDEHVTYVDLSLFSRSVSFEGKPYGFAYNEVAEALSSIWIVGESIGLSSQEINEIQTTFREEYQKHAPADIATPEAVIYFDSYWLLREINTLMKKYEKAYGEQKTMLEQKIEEKLNSFMKT